MIVSLATSVVLSIRVNELTREEQLAISYQRLAHVVVVLSRDFIHYLTRSTAKYKSLLINKISSTGFILHKQRLHNIFET